MSTDLLSLHLDAVNQSLMGHDNSAGKKKTKKNKKVAKSEIDIAKHRLELKDLKLKAVVEKLSKEKKRAKHSKGDIAKVVNAHNNSGRMKMSKFVVKKDE